MSAYTASNYHGYSELKQLRTLEIKLLADWNHFRRKCMQLATQEFYSAGGLIYIKHAFCEMNQRICKSNQNNY